MILTIQFLLHVQVLLKDLILAHLLLIGLIFTSVSLLLSSQACSLLTILLLSG